MVHSRPALLCHCLGPMKGKKALLCVLRGYKPIRIRHFQAGETDETSKLHSQKKWHGSLPVMQADVQWLSDLQGYVNRMVSFSSAGAYTDREDISVSQK